VGCGTLLGRSRTEVDALLGPRHAGLALRFRGGRVVRARIPPAPDWFDGQVD
jgi:hypothetical protein